RRRQRHVPRRPDRRPDPRARADRDLPGRPLLDRGALPASGAQTGRDGAALRRRDEGGRAPMSTVLTALSPERVAQLKRQACDRVDALAGELIALADDIHANPELGFQEVRTVGKVQELLGKHGIASQTGRAGLATGLRAELGGAGRPKVAIIAE